MNKKCLLISTAILFATNSLCTTFARGVTPVTLPTISSSIQIEGKLLDTKDKAAYISTPKSDKNLETVSLSKSEQKIKNMISVYLTSLEKYRNFSGQVLVEKEGKILIDRCYGYADYEKHIKPVNTTTFSIGSVTKQFTAAAIVQLEEDKKLSYDDKVSKYFGNVPFGDKITIHQLLTHMSGLTNFDESPDCSKLKPSEMTFDKLISLISDKPLDFEPGENWEYSNTGYLILGAIVEKVSGKPLQTYLDENIFRPIGMKNTGASYKLDKKLVDAKGYEGYLDTIPDKEDILALNAACGAGYLCSTVEDLYKWDVALRAGKIVSKESLLKIFGKYGDAKRAGYYGYGWFINSSNYGEEISHDGSTLGFTAENVIYTEKNAHVIIVTNKASAGLSGIKQKITEALKGNMVTPVKAWGTCKLSSTELDKFIGDFKSENYTAKVLKKSGKLELIINEQIYCELVAESKSKLYSRMMDVEVKAALDAKGNVIGLKVSLNGRSRDFIKVLGTTK